MGFMDKAKKLAEQAQQKLDEAQEQFNQGKGSS
jgi:DNA-binding protein YbaB